MIKYKYLSLLKFGGDFSLSFWNYYLPEMWVPDPETAMKLPKYARKFFNDRNAENVSTTVVVPLVKSLPTCRKSLVKYLSKFTQF